MITQSYQIDLIPNGEPLVVHVSQYDDRGRTLEFELFNGGVAFEPAGASVTIAGTKPDDTGFMYAMTVSGNVASIDMPQQIAAVAGDVSAEIRVSSGTALIGSANFIIRVEKAALDDETVISESDIPVFEELVVQAQSAASDAQSAASDAQSAASDAQSAAEEIEDLIPSAGTTGQYLQKTASGTQWADVDALPSGGTTGQVLTKQSSTDGDADWQTPTGGGAWGSITGTLSNQTDLQTALDEKTNLSNIATIETTSTASTNYTEGDFIVLNGQLYKVTTTVASGETWGVGLNIESASVGEELTALNNGLKPTVITGTFSKAVSASTVTEITKIALPSVGKWLILANVQLSTSGTGTYVSYLGTNLVRQSELNGGGVINYLYTTGNSDIQVRVWTSIATTVTGSYTAIRLGD